ncbi:uncharacterized protein BO72DRAFT_471672 [Aspergillus fijiensis CBS 313.89]|uniref:Aminoglycoside phosphotransferase domain-containing protein n=1 Tax=Aspergillus fijiensis CBS 313.89 TaxID=1448319 RepID=A0A8G1RJ79_9EURO|nr:uncharacterized protein BO72DRAFT_471672 [Aspergillus fijiensis CBS 313.89]RAK73407.1 hypothetical protein BO72DRAFT_471672 [Aspergillus fijiensis CBS 313.89]
MTTTLPFRITTRTITDLSEPTTTPTPESEHFFRYTSGRWLWDEEQQLRDRYKVFDVAALQSLAANAVRSDSCLSITKLAEGGYNKVFRLIMKDGKKVLARIPNPTAGPAQVNRKGGQFMPDPLGRDFLQIPVPRVLDWNATSKNAVGSEYIIMEEASGTQLGIVNVESKMLAAVESAVPAMLTNAASSELKERVRKRFSIGPTVDRSFWKKERSSMQIPRGPWRTPREYALSVGRRERAWIKRFAISKPSSEATLVSPAQNSPQAHLQLLEKYLQVAPALMDIDPVLTRPTLWHGDLHSSNLSVDDGRSILLQRPGNFDDLDPEQQAEIKQKIFKSTLYQLYLLETKERNPLLAQAFHLDHGKTRRLPVELAGNTWDDDIVSFREALINVERHWQELGIQGGCPYHFMQDELHSHAVDAEGWNEVQEFFDRIEGLVKRDGWISPDTFDAAFNFFSELRERGLKHMKGREKRAFDRQTRWARKQGG